MTTREVRVSLGGLSQQRVSQLVREGILVVERDQNGALQYDRTMVERYGNERANRSARGAEEREERRALRDEAADRFKRQRDAERKREAERVATLDALQERAVVALERIAKCLSQKSFGS